jgi:epoxyqueuosine reductase
MNSPQMTDSRANFEILENFERFHQKNEIFRRSQWDERIRSEKSERFYSSHGAVNEWRKAEGFRQQDYALRNAAWHISDVFTDIYADQGRREGFTDIFTLNTEIATEKADLGTPAQAAAEIKKVAKFFGAGDAGITSFDERWQYTGRFSDIERIEKPAEITLKWGWIPLS